MSFKLFSPRFMDVNIQIPEFPTNIGPSRVRPLCSGMMKLFLIFKLLINPSIIISNQCLLVTTKMDLINCQSCLRRMVKRLDVHPCIDKLMFPMGQIVSTVRWDWDKSDNFAVYQIKILKKCRCTLLICWGDQKVEIYRKQVNLL